MFAKLANFTLFRVKFYITPAAIIATPVLWLLYRVIANALFNLTTDQAAIAGIIGMVLHWLAAVIHQIGHAIAAERTGYPMTGVLIHFGLESSLYPRSEGMIPAEMHIQRALGGPILSGVFMVIGAVIALLTNSEGGLTAWVGLALLITNAIFCIGALIPMPFLIETDGTTIMKWWGKRGL